MSTEGDDAQRRGTKRERELSLTLGAIVEHMTWVGSGAPFDTLDVSRHVKLVTTDEHWTAQARAGARTAVIMVGRSDVTQIRPYTPYTALRYGTVLQVKEVAGGDILYWVAWDNGRVDAGDLEERIMRTMPGGVSRGPAANPRSLVHTEEGIRTVRLQRRRAPRRRRIGPPK